MDLNEIKTSLSDMQAQMNKMQEDYKKGQDILKNEGVESKGYEKALSKNHAELIKARGELLKNKGYSDWVVKEMLVSDINEVVKTNAPMNSDPSAGTNIGKELVPQLVTLDDVMDMSSWDASYAFLNAMREWLLSTWVLSRTTDIPLIGESPSATVYWEYTAWNYGDKTPGQTVGTDRVTLNAKKVGIQMGISDELELYWVNRAIESIKIASVRWINRAIADAVLNADSSTWATGNINSDDQLAATTYPNAPDGSVPAIRSFDDWVRKQVINLWDTLPAWGALTYNLIAQATWLLRFDYNPNAYFIVMDNLAYSSLKTDPVFQDRSINWDNSTVTTWSIGKIDGMEYFVTDLIRKSEADGKLSWAAPAGNTKGTLLIIKRNMIQHGFTAPVTMNIDASDILKGQFLQAKTHFGFANANKKAWITQPRSVGLINIG